MSEAAVCPECNGDKQGLWLVCDTCHGTGLAPEPKEIDHWHTGEVVCPHCGYTYGDSVEFFPSSSSTTRITCDGCHKKFEAEQEIDVYYTTSKLKESNP